MVQSPVIKCKVGALPNTREIVQLLQQPRISLFVNLEQHEQLRSHADRTISMDDA